MSPTAKSISLVLALALVAGTWLGTARAQPADDQATAAEFLFEEGRRLMDAGQYAEACDKFAASHEADPSVGALLNLGACQDRLGRTASAWTSFRQAAAMARRQGDQRRVAFASKRADELEGKLSYVIFEVAAGGPDDLRVVRDQSEVPSSLWNQRIPVDPGDYTITATAPGYRGWSSQISVAARGDGGGEITRVRVPALEPDPNAAAEGPAQASQNLTSSVGSEPARDSGGGGRTAAIASGVVGVIGLGAGVLFALQSQSKNDQAYDDGLCDSQNICEQRGVDLIDESRAAARNAYIAYGVGAAAVAIGAVLWFTGGSDAEADPDATALRPQLGPGLAGIAITGSF